MHEEPGGDSVLDKFNFLNEKTFLPVSLVIVIVLSASFILRISYRTDSHEERLKIAEAKIDAISEMKTDVAVIRIQLEELTHDKRRKENGR